jgi:hypothetical protein
MITPTKMKLRTRRSLLAAGSVALALAGAGAHASAPDRQALLASSRAIAHQAHVQTRSAVDRRLASELRAGREAQIVPLAGARIQLGQYYANGVARGHESGALPGAERLKLDGNEVEEHPLPGIREDSVQAPIPFGLGAIGWGLSNPSQAARVLLPVLGPSAASEDAERARGLNQGVAALASQPCAGCSPLP